MAKSKNENINISIFTALKVSEISKVPVLIMSNPGLGKSTTVAMFAKVRGYELQLLRGNSTTAEEVLGYDVADQSDDAKTTKHLRPSWYTKILENHENGKPTLLFLDEITTANEFVQSALLHLIFERMVGDEHLPEDTLIISAGNYAQNLSNTMTLLPPLMNRFMIYNIVPSHKDLDTFLCKFEGSIASGKPNNYMAELQGKMKELDSQELDIPEDQYNKIGEYIERGIKETAKFLMTGGNKPVDLGVTELQNLYADMETDSKLYGFVTFRSLNYLRDVSIAMFKCFGKAGITSDNYRNMIDGLCGIGVSRDPKTKDVKTTPIGKEFYDYMINVVNDIEKMKNDRLPKYEKFFSDLANSKDIYGIPEMNAIVNKIEELKADKELSQIERPIDPDTLEAICKTMVKSSKSIIKIKVSTTDKIMNKMTPEQFMGNVHHWNTIAELVTTIQSLVGDNSRGYKDKTSQMMNDTRDELKNVAFKLRSLRKIMLNEDPALTSVIPEVKSFK